MLRMFLMFDSKKMVDDLNYSPAIIPARDQAEHQQIQGEYIDTNFHWMANIQENKGRIQASFGAIV